MSHRISRTLSLMAVFAVLLALPVPAHAQGYTFTKIADSAEGLDSFGCPGINDRSDVVVRATRDEDGVTVIFVHTDQGRIPIADNSSRFGFMGRNPSLNDQGAVSFAANVDAGGEGIFRGSGGPLATIAQTDPGQFNFFGFDTSLNNSGRVAFKAELDDFDEGLFSGRGPTAIGPGVTTHYLASTSPFGGDDSRPSINDVGAIAFEEFLDAGGRGIFVIRGSFFITIADDSGPIDSAQDPTLNAHGVVAFHAFLDDGGQAIFKGDGGPLETIADTTGPYSSFDFAAPSLNDDGLVAFPVSLDTGGQGIFTGPDPDADRVIMTGDMLDGSVVTSLSLCWEGLNNGGELAFSAQLDDGRSGIFRATPSMRSG